MCITYQKGLPQKWFFCLLGLSFFWVWEEGNYLISYSCQMVDPPMHTSPNSEYCKHYFWVSINHQKNDVLAKWYPQSKISEIYRHWVHRWAIQGRSEHPCQSSGTDRVAENTRWLHRLRASCTCLSPRGFVRSLDQKAASTGLLFIMDNHSFKHKAALYNQTNPDGQLPQSQIYTQDTDF